MDLEPTAGSSVRRTSSLSVKLKTIIGLGLVEICSYASITCVASFLSKEGQSKGLSISMAGIIFVATPLVIVVASPFLGIVVGKVGARKCFFAGMILLGVSNVGIASVDRISSPFFFSIGCIFCRIITGMGTIALNANLVLMVEAFPTEVNKAIGLNQMFSGIGASIGPSIGGLLYDWGGFPMPFLTIGIVTLFLIPPSAYCLPEVSNTIEDKEDNSIKIWNLIGSPKILVNLLATLAFGIGSTFLEPIFEPKLREDFGTSSSLTGTLFLLFGLTYTVASIWIGKIADSVKYPWIFVFLGCLGSSLSILALDPSLLVNIPNFLVTKFFVIGIFGTFVGLGLGPIFGTMILDTSSRSIPDTSSMLGTLSGFWCCFYSLGSVIGPSSGAVIGDHFGFNTMCTVVSVTFFLTAAIYLLVYSTTGKKRN